MLPTTFELAKLAILLKPDANDFERSAETALRLWSDCERVIEREKGKISFEICIPDAKCKLIEIRDRLKKSKIKILQPKSFPAPLSEFLRLIVGGRTKSQRSVSFRKFLSNSHLFFEMKNSESEPVICDPDLARISEVFETYRSGGFDEQKWNDVAVSFLAWKELVRIERARKGGLGKKKRLEATKDQTKDLVPTATAGSDSKKGAKVSEA